MATPILVKVAVVVEMKERGEEVGQAQANMQDRQLLASAKRRPP